MIRTYKAGLISSTGAKSPARAKLAAARKARESKAARINTMSASVLLAILSDDQKAYLAATLKTRKVRSDARPAAAAQTDWAARAIAVLSHEHAQGRMDSAKKLLANEKLSADEIINILAMSTSVEARNDAAAEMRHVLSEIAEREGSAASSAQAGNKSHIWAKAHERAFGEAGE